MRGRKDPIPPVNVVALPGVHARIPEAPEYLSPLARKCWDETVRIMVARNTYDDDCLQTVAAYCIQYARLLEADEKLRKNGLFVGINKGNGQKKSPYLTVSNQAWDRMVRLACELGLTPVSRKKTLKIRGNSKSAPAAQYLKSA